MATPVVLIEHAAAVASAPGPERTASSPIRSPPVCSVRNPIIAGRGWGGSFERRGESALSSDVSRRMAYRREAGARQALGLRG